MSLSMLIYNHSPIFVQNILTSIKGFQMRKERFSNEYRNELEEIDRIENLNQDEKIEIQLKKFKDLVSFAKKNSPFYQNIYKDIDLNHINSIDDITALPVVSKEMVRANLKDMYTLSEKDSIVSNTSGTTGTSMKFLYTKADFQKRLAYLDYFKAKHGFKALSMRRASFTSPKIIPINQKSKIYWRYNIAMKQRIYSSYHIRGESIKYVIDDLNKFKPKSIDGYPSAIYEVAKYIKENNVKLKFVPVAIFPTAETLLPKYKMLMEDVFQCPVRDQYASSEGAPFITECQFGRLHYNLITGIIETNDEDEMIVTCFNTFGTPLIRYEIGDKCVFDNENKICECGSGDPIIKIIEGRNLDFISTPSNGNFPAIYFSLVSEEFDNSIRKMQFIQNKLDEVVILLEVDQNYNQSMNKIIIDKLKYSLGSDMKLQIELTDNIPIELSGKFRLIKRNI